MNWKPFVLGILATIVVSGLVYGAYAVGKNQPGKGAPATTAPQPETLIPNLSSPKPEDSGTNTQTITAIAGGLQSFYKYSVTLPAGWGWVQEGDGQNSDELVITKDASEIRIYQAATGGALCLYPGDAPFNGPSATYEIWTDLTTADGENLRRSGNAGELKFTVCKKQDDNSYFAPTPYGHISIEAEMSTLTEIDSILETLKKV